MNLPIIIPIGSVILMVLTLAEGLLSGAEQILPIGGSGLAQIGAIFGMLYVAHHSYHFMRSAVLAMKRKESE